MSSDPIEQLFTEFPTLETPRLILRTLDEDDADDLFAIFGDDDVTRYYDLETFQTLGEAYELIDFMQESFETERQVRWGIERKADRRLIGTCGFVWLRRYSTEIGYDLAKDCWGDGAMREALTALLAYAFDELCLNRIEALVLPQNRRSIKLLNGLGFTHEGTLRQYDYFKGAFHDMEMHALLRVDYGAAR